MSAEELKQKLIPLIKAGYRDDVRCLMLLHLKDHPQDDEVWYWYVAATRDPAARRRIVERWLRHNPASPRAFEILARLRMEPPDSLVTGSLWSGSFPGPSGQPFGAREFITTLFVGQDSLVADLAILVERLKQGATYHIALRAPGGRGKSLLAGLILQYVDPRGENSRVHSSASLRIPEDLQGRRFHLVEDVDQLTDPAALRALLTNGEYSFLFTQRSQRPLPEDLASQVQEFVFTEYTRVDLGLIAYETLLRRGFPIPTRFMMQIAGRCQGSPRQAVAIAERLGLVWRLQGAPGTLGELIYQLDETLELWPPEPARAYLAIWKDEILHAPVPGMLIAALRERQFPFGLRLHADRRSLQFVPPDQRRAQVGAQVMTLPPYIFQTRFNPAGPLAPTLRQAETQGIILGAYSAPELEALVSLCDFVVGEDSQARQAVRVYQPIPEDIQKEVWDRDRGRCALCGSAEELAYDHLIPLSQGGSNTARNLQLICQPCSDLRMARPGGQSDR